MGHRSALNQKRLTKKQVQELITVGGELDVELTACFREEREGWVNAPKVYNLPGNRCLYVFDENDISLPGKGDIFPREEMLKHAEWHDDVRRAYEKGGGNSIADWRHYSKLDHELVTHVANLIHELAEVANLRAEQLNFSYKSLDLVSAYLISIGYQRARRDWFDHLVAYVGEVLRQRSEGKWQVQADGGGLVYPCILGPKGDHVMMPINVVWEALDVVGECQLRRPTTNEYHRYCVQNAPMYR